MFDLVQNEVSIQIKRFDKHFEFSIWYLSNENIHLLTSDQIDDVWLWGTVVVSSHFLMYFSLET